MGSSLISGRSRGASLIGGTRAPAIKKPKKQGYSVGGFLGNVASDVKDTIYGTPAALKTIGQATAGPLYHDIVHGYESEEAEEARRKSNATLKAVGKSYAQTYGPLVKGDFKKFARNLYDDGFYVGADILTAASAGTAALAKAPIVGAKVATAGKATRLSTGAGSVEKALSSKPFRGNLQRAARATGQAVIRPRTPGVGEYAQAGRVIARETQRAMERNVRAVAPAQRAVQKLRGPEAVAAVLIRDLPLKKDLDRYVAQLTARGTPGALSAAQLISKPRVQKLYANPNRRVQRAADELGVVAQENERLLGGFLDEKAAAQRPFLHTLLVRGARFVDEETGRNVPVPPRATPPQGALFHGSPEGVIAKVDPYHHTRTWKEGVGFYVTESLEKAKGYARGRTARGERLELADDRGGITYVQLRPHARVMDMDAPADMAFWREAANGLGDPFTENDWRVLREQYHGANPTNSEMRNAIRQYAEVDPYAMEEIFHRRGIQATTHIEGRGATPHRVWIVKDENVLEHVGGHPLRDLEGAVRTETKTTGRKILAPPPGFASVDEAIEGIRAELKAEGRPEPVYTPDTSDFAEPLPVQAGRGGGSAQAGANLMRSAGAQDLGVLFMSGQRIIDPQPLLNKYLWNTKQQHYLDIHNELLKHADEVDVVPNGYEVVRRPARPFAKEVSEDDFRVVGRSPERIPYQVQRKGDYEKFLREHLPADNPFTTRDLAEAMRGPGGGVLVVPKTMAAGVKGEFTRMSRFAYWVNTKPVKVWRAAVLNLRPAWLVNNVIGNSFLYAISNMDAQGIRALNEVFKKRHSKQAGEFDRIMDEFFARQQTGTFIGTQRPRYAGRNWSARALDKLVGSLAEVDRLWEQGLRRASVKAEIRRNPALRQAVKDMRVETRDFWQAARKTLDDNPVLVQQVENRVNDALGNFTSLSKFERDVLRTAFPFYAWYRAITGVTLKLPLDQPAKFQILTRLAQVGLEQNLEDMGVTREEIPDFLRGFIPTGPAEGDRMPGISTASANPFSTVDQMGKFAAALGMWAGGKGDPGDVGRALPGVNPFFLNIAEGVFGTDPRGAPVSGPPLVGIYQDLPQVRLAEAFGINADPFTEPYQGTASKPRLYDQDPRDQLLRFLGLPYARISRRRARQMATESR